MKYALSFVEVDGEGNEVERIPYDKFLFQNASAADITAAPQIGDKLHLDDASGEQLLEGIVRDRRFIYAGLDCLLEVRVERI